jgi:hypothetical protein
MSKFKGLKVVGYKIKCCKCNSPCKESSGLLNTLTSSEDFGDDRGKPGTTQSRTGLAKLVKCMKCSNCGHSFIP